jgi:hypothetical protein
LVKENRDDSKVKNSEIIKKQKQAGRDFFGISEAEFAFLRNQVVNYFKRKFKL